MISQYNFLSEVEDLFLCLRDVYVSFFCELSFNTLLPIFLLGCLSLKHKNSLHIKCNIFF